MSQLLLVDHTAAQPEANLALDEALLNHCEHAAAEGNHLEVLRFWESEQPFVVLGSAGRLAEEVIETACSERGIPILRRASGGGTVVQGPGCLNYALVLSRQQRPDLTEIGTSYRFILNAVARALNVPGLRLQGTFDLAVNGRKVSGNAQRRKRLTLLHHGTLLYNFDLSLISSVLHEPAKQPAYRDQRPHAAFVTNLSLSAESIRMRLTSAWNATSQHDLDPTHVQMDELIANKYSKEEWVRRF